MLMQNTCACEGECTLPAALRAALAAPVPGADEAKSARVEALQPGGAFGGLAEYWAWLHSRHTLVYTVQESACTS